MQEKIKDDTISRQAVLDALDDIESEVAEGYGYQYAKWRKYICDLPPAQPGRKAGEWIPQDHNKQYGYGNVSTLLYYYPKCSECGNTGDYIMSYCPNCGADMKGGD